MRTSSGWGSMVIDHAGCDLRMRGEIDLDFAEFDAKARGPSPGSPAGRDAAGCRRVAAGPGLRCGNTGRRRSPAFDRSRSGRPSTRAGSDTRGHPRAADADLAGHADRDRARPCVVHDLDESVGHGTADQDALVRLDYPPAGRPDRRLGRAVQVPQLAGARPSAAAARSGGSASPPVNALSPGAALPARVEQQPPGRRRRLHHGHAGGFQQRVAARRDRCASFAAREHDLRADDQRQQQLQHRDVERQRGRPPATGPRPSGPARRAMLTQEVDHAAVRDHDALGLAGGAGGVDHVGRDLRRWQSTARRRCPGATSMTAHSRSSSSVFAGSQPQILRGSRSRRSAARAARPRP